MNHTGIAGERDWHTRLFESLAVGFPLIAQRVILCCRAAPLLWLNESLTPMTQLAR